FQSCFCVEDKFNFLLKPGKNLSSKQIGGAVTARSFCTERYIRQHSHTHRPRSSQKRKFHLFIRPPAAV
ncbi:MAG TPA: hypothetical protein H9840_05670, partial [Candidatus Anaerofilum excrementigallinarum]|nr:hypothetical protein [Candidatus Anaerofilum excrementigallinarum]